MYVQCIASEWKSFLLYIIPVAMNGILPEKYYVHVLLLVKSIRLLLADCVTQVGLKLAEKLLRKFCCLFEDYYGKIQLKYMHNMVFLGISNCSVNIHSLLHLAFYVKLFGPLWTHSAFAFEGQMQNFLRHSHATHGIGKQVNLLMA